MRKLTTITITTATLAITAISTTMALAGPANATDECTPSNGTDASPGAWAWDSFTDWSASDATPADPDNAIGEENLANLVQVGEGWTDTRDAAYRQQVSDGRQRFTAWQTSDVAPSVGANEETGHRYEQIVGNGDATQGTPAIPGTPAVPGTPATPEVWANFSPNHTEGPFDGPPSYPTDSRGTWNVHDQLPPGQAGPDGVYQNGNGNGSWFYRAAGAAGTPGTPAVEGTPEVPGAPETSHVEYRWDVYAFHYEYRWSVYERGIIEGTAPVTCDIDGPIDEPTDEPTGTQTAEAPADELTTPETPQTPQTPDTNAPVAHVPAAPTPKQHRAAAAVPTTIDAGL